MSKPLLQQILKHHGLDRGEIHWYTGYFSMQHELSAGERYALDDDAVYDESNDHPPTLSSVHTTCVIALRTDNSSTVWLDETADPTMLQGLVEEFLKPATAKAGCAAGT